MKHQTNIASLMLVSSSVLCAILLKDVAYASILCVLGLLGLRRKIILAIQPERRVLSLLILLFLLALFGIHYWFVVWPSHGQFGPGANIAWATVTRYFLASMVLMLFLGLPDQLPLSFGFFYVATIVSAGQVFYVAGNMGLYRSLEIVSVVLLLFYTSMTSGSPLRQLLDKKGFSSHMPRVLVLVALFVTLNVGWILGSILYQRQGAIMFLSNLWKNQAALLTIRESSSQIGFSRSGRLSTINNLIQSEDQDVAVRITSNRGPGYLRAQSFDVFRRGRWRSQPTRKSYKPDSFRVDLSLGNRFGVYHFRDLPEARLESMVVKHVKTLGDATFLPINLSELATTDSYLLIDQDFIVVRPHITAQSVYAVKYSRTLATKPPSRTQRDQMLFLSMTQKNELGALSDSIYKDAVTTQDKMRTTVRHFKENYAYSLLMPPQESGDPLIRFLQEGTSGYCEYFASGAALLLRTVNVPTRYVTGFYVAEKETLTPNTWVARNQDAHAWVEAWDDDHQCWRIVEATVQDALNDDLANGSDNQNGLQRFIFVQRLMQALYQYGVAGLLVWLYSEGGWLLQFGLSAAIALGMVVAFRKLTLTTTRPNLMHHASRSHEWRKLQKLRARLEQCLKRQGLDRQPHETLQAFAQTVSCLELAPQTVTSIQDWYTQYNQLRFSRDISSLRLEQLGNTLTGVIREVRKKGKR